MRLTKKLISFLNRVFDKDPAQFLALRLQYAGGMSWKVDDGVLTTTVVGGIGTGLSISLKDYTVDSLVNYLAAQPGYTVVYADQSEYRQLSALVLLDGGADIGTSNGDRIFGYTSFLWSYYEAAANELAAAETQIGEMLKQMSTKTASGEWLVELGNQFGVPQLPGEQDVQYGPRIVAEVLRARSNNIAIENAISAYTGQSSKVTDVVQYGTTPPLHNGTYTYNGAQFYNSTASPLYGLFDIEYGYDLLNGTDITAFKAIVHDLVERLRAAGTHLRSVLLTGSALADSLTPPADGGNLQLAATAALADTLTAPTETFSLIPVALAPMTDAITPPADADTGVVNYGYTYNALRTYNGNITHQGGVPEIYPAPVLDVEFSAGVPATIVHSRSTVGMYTDFDGSLKTAAANVPRIDYKPDTHQWCGLLLEDAATNMIRNNTMQGAAAGIAPTFWGFTTPVDGLTLQILGSGIENGINYLDFRYSGTVSAGNVGIGVDLDVSMAAAAGQTWTNSAYMKLVAGSFAGITQAGVNILTADSSAVTIDNVTNNLLGLLDGILRRYSVTQIFNANTATTRPRLRFLTGAAGSIVDFTVRVGLPQFEQRSFATSPIQTTGATATRAADICTSADISWFNASEGSVYVEGDFLGLRNDNGTSRIASFDNGGSNMMALRAGNVIGGSDLYVVNATPQVDSNSFTIAAGTSIRQAYAYRLNDFAFTTNGGAVLTDAAGTVPAITRFVVADTLFCGHIRRIRYMPRRMSNNELKTLTA